MLPLHLGLYVKVQMRVPTHGRTHTFTQAFNQRQKKLTYRKRAATVRLRSWVQTVEKRARTSLSQQELRAAVLKWLKSYVNP